MVALSYDQGMAICKAYEKLDGHCYANFIDENFESMFAIADKSQM